MYKIKYLPLALDDLKKIVRYIALSLEAPQAAENLIAKIDKELLKVADNPYHCHLYVSPEKMNYEYRVLNVNNYSLFYVVEDNIVEIHRVIYSKRDIPRILKRDE